MNKKWETVVSEFGNDFLKENYMGPNSMMVMAELAESLELRPGMKILDLGCGKGLSSFYLAKYFDVTVFATDLWIQSTENFERVQQLGLENRVFPVYADARALPYAKGFFDVAVSVDAYHYFGTDESYLDTYFAPLVKSGGQLAIAVPGVTEAFYKNGASEGLKNHAYAGDAVTKTGEFPTFKSNAWWNNLWKRSSEVNVIKSFDLKCHNEAWNDWLYSGNEIGKGDIPFIEADTDNQLAIVSVIAKKK